MLVGRSQETVTPKKLGDGKWQSKDLACFQLSLGVTSEQEYLERTQVGSPPLGRVGAGSEALLADRKIRAGCPEPAENEELHK